MSTNQQQENVPEIQAALYHVATSLESLLVNGIPSGVIHGDVFNGFLEKTAGNLLTDLATLDQHAERAPFAEQPKIREVLTTLRVRCQQLIDLLVNLRLFRTLPLEQLHSDVGRVSLLHEECVLWIQELEHCFRIPRPFYSSRPAHSTAAVTAFLENLERLFADERMPVQTRCQDSASQP